MLKHETDIGMVLCCFLDMDNSYFTCDDCDMRKIGVCTPEFRKKHGYRRDTLDVYFRRVKNGINTRPED